MPNQTTIGGFTITFNGITVVPSGYEWSYTIVNDGTEKDLSNWVLQLHDCLPDNEELPCSLGKCEVVTQICPPSSAPCATFRGVKFDDLPDDQRKQTFTFILSQPASVTTGCFYLKYGQNRVCGEIDVPDCSDDPACPPCPPSSLRDGQIFTQYIELPSSHCQLSLLDTGEPLYSLCVNGVRLEEGTCDQEVDVTLCKGSNSEQTIICLLPLDYVLVKGTLQIIWQLQVQLLTACEESPVLLATLLVSNLDLYEICYFCEGERPEWKPEDICDWFEIDVINVSSDGYLTYRVTFRGCEEPHEE